MEKHSLSEVIDLIHFMEIDPNKYKDDLKELNTIKEQILAISLVYGTETLQ